MKFDRELKPCPFCGSRKIRVVKEENGIYEVECSDCLANVYDDTEVGAKEYWNRRVIREVYKAIAKDDLVLDNSQCYWKKGEVYDAEVNEFGEMTLQSESGQSYYTPEAVKRLKEVFDFERR